MRAAAIALCVLLSGCTLLGNEELPPPPSTPTATATGATPAPEDTIAFSGIVRDAATREPLPAAIATLQLAQSQPCLRPGIGWRSWDMPVAANGTFGPIEVPRPRSDDVAFFVHVRADGYSDNLTPIGPTSRRALAFDVALHPVANVTGTAAPGTLVALDHPGFPRIALAGADGRFAFEGVRSVPAGLVAGTDEPWSIVVEPNATLAVPTPAQRGWTLEGSVKGPTGAGLASDLVAFNGTRLVGVARSSATGAFEIHLPREIGRIDLVARTSDGHYGASKVVDIAGPPALTETLLAKARC